MSDLGVLVNNVIYLHDVFFDDCIGCVWRLLTLLQRVHTAVFIPQNLGLTKANPAVSDMSDFI